MKLIIHHANIWAYVASYYVAYNFSILNGRWCL